MTPHRWVDLPTRLLTVSLGFPAVVFVLGYSELTRKLFFASVHFLACWEWMNLIPGTAPAEKARLLIVIRTFFSFISIFLSLAANERYFMSLLIVITSVVYLLHVHISLQRSNKNIDRNGAFDHYLNHLISHIFMGFIFLSIPFFHWQQLSCVRHRQDLDSIHNSIVQNATAFQHVLYVLCIVWNSDSGGLVAGRFFGPVRKYLKLSTQWDNSPLVHLFDSFSRISPSKTFAGILGGITSGILTAVYFPGIFNYLAISSCVQSWCPLPPPPFFQVERPIFLGLVLSTFAIFGDVVESAVKRVAKRKDSGCLLPGHGTNCTILDDFFPILFMYQLNSKCVLTDLIWRRCLGSI
jgi:phosphatidate cytidylyltransferase